MERINKDKNPIYYKNVEEMDKPMSELINELRNEISITRGKLHDIKRSYGWNEWIEIYEGGLTCLISAMSNFQDELLKFEKKQELKEKKSSSNENKSIIGKSYSIIQNGKRIFGKVESYQGNTGGFWVRWDDGEITLESNVDNAQ